MGKAHVRGGYIFIVFDSEDEATAAYTVMVKITAVIHIACFDGYMNAIAFPVYSSKD